MSPQEPAGMFSSAELALAVSATVRVRGCLDEQIEELEKAVRARAKRRAEFARLLSTQIQT